MFVLDTIFYPNYSDTFSYFVLSRLGKILAEDILIFFPENRKRHLMQTVRITFVCVEVLRSSQPNGVMSSAVSLPNHTLTGQA